MTARTSVTIVWILGFAATAAPSAAQGPLDRLENQIRRAGQGAPSGGPAATVAPIGQSSGRLGAVGDDKDENGRGVRVLDVRPNGPAQRAGIRRGDLITAVGGTRVAARTDLAAALAARRPGDKVSIVILRDGRVQTLQAILSGPPAPGPEMVPPPPGEPIPAPGPTDDPPLRFPSADPPADSDRVERLQRRIEQLERRVTELERLLAEPPKKR